MSGLLPLLACVGVQADSEIRDAEDGEHTGAPGDTGGDQDTAGQPDTGTDTADTGRAEVLCTSTFDAAAVLKLCGSRELSYAGWEGLDTVVDQDGTPWLLVGSVNDNAVYAVDAASSSGAVTLTEGPTVHALEGTGGTDSVYAWQVDAVSSETGIVMAVTAPRANWYHSGDGRVFVYDVPDFGALETAETRATVQGDHEYHYLGGATALIPGEAGDMGLVVGRDEVDVGGAPSAYVFWSLYDTDALASDADVVLTIDDFEAEVGDDVGAADMTGDGLPDALVSLEHYDQGIAVVEFGLTGSLNPGDLPAARPTGELDGDSFANADLDDDGYQDLVVAWKRRASDPPSTASVVPGPFDRTKTTDEAIGGVEFGGERTWYSCVAAADVQSGGQVTLAWQGDDRVFLHYGAVAGWIEESDPALTALAREDDSGAYFWTTIPPVLADLDLDGVRDVVIAASDWGENDQGAVYVFWEP